MRFLRGPGKKGFPIGTGSDKNRVVTRTEDIDVSMIPADGMVGCAAAVRKAWRQGMWFFLFQNGHLNGVNSLAKGPEFFTPCHCWNYSRNDALHGFRVYLEAS